MGNFQTIYEGMGTYFSNIAIYYFNLDHNLKKPKKTRIKILIIKTKSDVVSDYPRVMQ